MANAPRVLWLDDDLDSDRATYMLVWHTWFKKAHDSGLCNVQTCSSLRQFASLLSADDQEFDLLVLDVMLKRESSSHFGDVGFNDERILPLDGGVQLLGLIRNARHQHERPAWMNRYRDKPVVLLSSSPSLPVLVSQYVDCDRRQGVHFVTKALDTTVAGKTQPDQSFEHTLKRILRGLTD